MNMKISILGIIKIKINIDTEEITKSVTKLRNKLINF